MKSNQNHAIPTSGRMGTRALIYSVAICALALSSTFAATLTWDGSGNGSSPNTSGTWTTTGTNWNLGTATWNNSNNDTAVFGTGVTSSGTRTVTLGEDITVGGLGFAAPGGFTITGSSTLTLGGTNPTITLTVNATINSVLAGSSGLNAVSAATSKTLTLNGLNTYTGTTTIGSGLTVAANTLANGGVASSLGAGSSAATDLVLAGTLSYTGTGSSTDRLFTIANTAVVLAANGSGTVNFTNTGHLGITTGAATTLTLNGTNTGANTLAIAIDNPSSGSTGVTKNGTGQWVLSGNSSYTGVTLISAGTLSATTLADGGVTSSIGASTNAADRLVVDGGAFRYIGTGASTDRLFTVAKNGGVIESSGTGAVNFTNTGALGLGTTNATTTRTLTLAGSNTGNNTLAASYADKGGTSSASALVKSGSGKWIITGAHTYTGGTQVADGTLVLGSATTLQSATGLLSITGGTLSSNVSETSVGSDIALSSGFLTPGDSAIGKVTLSAGKDFSMTGGEIHLTLGISFDQLGGSTGSNFSLTGGLLVLDVSGSGFSYGSTYTIFQGFDTTGNVVTLGDGTTGVKITGYDTTLWTANLDATTGTLSFTSVPEPSAGIMLSLGCLLFLFGSRQLSRQKKS